MDGLHRGHIAAHLNGTQKRFTAAIQRATTHMKHHPGFVSWSGGKDSTTVVHIATQIDPTIPIVFYDSGLEFPENVTYMHDLATDWNLNFHTIKADPDALTILAATEAWNHHTPLNPNTPNLHQALITTPSLKAHHEHGNGNLWGLRAQESNGRRALLAKHQGTFTRKTGQVVTAPIWDWNDDNVWAYLTHHHIPENPVYTRLKQLGATGPDLRVGLALDGNNLQHGRVRWLRLGWPDMYQQLTQTLPRLTEYR